MKRNMTKTRISEDEVRYRVRLDDDIECAQDSQEGRMRQAYMLQAMSDTINLTHCGPKIFAKMTMYHQGHWIVDLEAINQEDAKQS